MRSIIYVFVLLLVPKFPCFCGEEGVVVSIEGTILTIRKDNGEVVRYEPTQSFLTDQAICPCFKHKLKDIRKGDYVLVDNIINGKKSYCDGLRLLKRRASG